MEGDCGEGQGSPRTVVLRKEKERKQQCTICGQDFKAFKKYV